MVCGYYGKIHRYKSNGEALDVINAAVIPCSVTPQRRSRNDSIQ